MPFDTTLTTNKQATNVVWTGSEYLVLILDPADPADNTITTVDASGHMGSVFATLPLASGSLFAPQSLAWSGSILGALSSDGMTIRLLRYDGTGDTLGSTMLATASGQAALAWAGDRFVAVWQEPLGKLAMVEVTPDGVAGAALDPLPGVVNAGVINTLAASPTTYVVTTEDPQQPSVTLIDRASHQVIQRALDLGNAFDYVSVGVRGTALAVEKSTGDHPVFETLDPTTGMTGPAIAVSLSATSSTMAATESGYRVFGGSSSVASQLDLAEVDIDPAGTAAGSSIPIVTITASEIGVPVSVSTGTKAVTLSLAYGQDQNFSQRVIQQCAP